MTRFLRNPAGQTLESPLTNVEALTRLAAVGTPLALSLLRVDPFDLTDTQLYLVHKLAIEGPPRVISFPALAAHLNTGLSAGLKRVHLTFPLFDVKIRKNGSYIVCKDRKVFGYLSPAGDWTDAAKDAGVVGELRKLETDPVAYAAVAGREVGQCCYCRLGLTDPWSVKFGYGPICAGKYSLPHGPKGWAEVEKRIQNYLEIDWRPAEVVPEDFYAM